MRIKKPSRALAFYRFWPLTKFFALVGMIVMMLGIGRTASADYQIGPDDVLQIKVYGYDDLDSESKVSESGRITFPLIGEITVGGLTTFGVEKKIADALVGGNFIKNPQVTVSVMEYQGQLVSVLGQVKKPGRYPLKSASTLIDLIAMAGGINENGDDRVIVTSRIDGKLSKREVNLREALELSDQSSPLTVAQGDIVYIPKAPVFYIYGEVQKAGAYRLEPKISVAQAISLGGGLTPRGSLRGIVIERRNSDGKHETLDAELSDPVKKDDIVVVDERWF